MKPNKIELIADGIIGAFVILEQIIKRYTKEQVDIIFNYLLENNIKGSDLWVEYNDKNHEDIEAMVNSFNIL